MVMPFTKMDKNSLLKGFSFFKFVTDIVTAHKNRKICSLIGVEGGHSMSNSLAVLRTFYLLGVRYMTLTSTCHTPWADSSYADAPKFDKKHGGLTEFGKVVFLSLFFTFQNGNRRKLQLRY